MKKNSDLVILILAFRRPDLLEKRLREMDSFKEFEFVVSIDRLVSDERKQLSKQFRNIQNNYSDSNIKWIFRDTNLGIAQHMLTAVDEIMNEYSRCVVIEDDIKIYESPLRSLIARLIQGLPDDIFTIGLFGGLPDFGNFKSLHVKNRWRRTPYFSAWCWGTEKVKWIEFRKTIMNEESWESGNFESLHWNRMSESRKNRWNYRFGKLIKNPKFTWDYQIQFFSFQRNMSHYLPRFRSVENEGFGDERASNTKSGKPNWYLGNSSVQEISEDFDGKYLEKILRYIDSWTWAEDRTIPIWMKTVRKFVALKARIFQSQ